MVLCGRRNVTVDGEVAQESLNVRRPELLGMPQSVEPDVTNDPAPIGFLGMNAHVPTPARDAEALDELRAVSEVVVSHGDGYE